MTLTPEEKAARARQRMIVKAREYQLGTYAAKFVAPVFQQMIRANAAALPAGMTYAVVDGELARVYRRVGQCACVTCGKVLPWKNSGRTHGSLDTGHFLHGVAAIRFDEDNVAPQCVHCNQHRDGASDNYRLWMTERRGTEIIERLTRLNHTTRRFTREELVDMRVDYAARLKAAIDRMEKIA
jgi:hypothetical protein